MALPPAAVLNACHYDSLSPYSSLAIPSPPLSCPPLPGSFFDLFIHSPSAIPSFSLLAVDLPSTAVTPLSYPFFLYSQLSISYTGLLLITVCLSSFPTSTCGICSSRTPSSLHQCLLDRVLYRPPFGWTYVVLSSLILHTPHRPVCSSSR